LAPREARAFGLALILFLCSLFAGRLVAENPVAISPVASPSTTSTPVVPTPSATTSPTAAPTSTPTPPPPTPTIQETGTVLLDEANTTLYTLPDGCLIHPLRLVRMGTDFYVLDTGQLKLVALDTEPMCTQIVPPDRVVVQELADLDLSGDGESLLLLDRAGNSFRYTPITDDWLVERAALAPEASSRQYLVSVRAYEDSFYLLDANVGQIWQHTEEREVIIPTDLDLRESVDLAAGESIYVLTQAGYRGPLQLHKLAGEPLQSDSGFVPPPDIESSSLLFLDRDSGMHLYILDRSHHRLRLLDAATGDLVRDYVFADEETEIYAVFSHGQTLYLASRGRIYVYPREPAGPAEPAATPTPEGDLSALPPHDSRVLELLPPLALPIEGTMLPGLSFRLPGAPRSYRYGVHQGIDFYWAAGEMVTDTTPALSVAAGVVIRIDSDYQAPTLQEMEAMLAETEEVFHTPEDILDALRGRQVWIEHDGGAISRYCHLSAVAPNLRVGDYVNQGQMIGYVGNSGTPASYYDSAQEIHLHLEIRVGEGYVGQYLRPIQVKRWLEEIFSADA
jgi:murein DD-endopeptidase MepM/ murein hydrolase activator NlpD